MPSFLSFLIENTK